MRVCAITSSSVWRRHPRRPVVDATLDKRRILFRRSENKINKRKATPPSQNVQKKIENIHVRKTIIIRVKYKVKQKKGAFFFALYFITTIIDVGSKKKKNSYVRYYYNNCESYNTIYIVYTHTHTVFPNDNNPVSTVHAHDCVCRRGRVYHRGEYN